MGLRDGRDVCLRLLFYLELNQIFFSRHHHHHHHPSSTVHKNVCFKQNKKLVMAKKKSVSLLGHVCVLGYCYLFALLNCLCLSTNKEISGCIYKIPDFCSLFLKRNKLHLEPDENRVLITSSFMSNLKQNVSNLFLYSIDVCQQITTLIWFFLYHNLNCDMNQSHKMSNFHRSSDGLIAKCFLLCEKFSENFKCYEFR